MHAPPWRRATAHVRRAATRASAHARGCESVRSGVATSESERSPRRGSTSRCSKRTLVLLCIYAGEPSSGRVSRLLVRAEISGDCSGDRVGVASSLGSPFCRVDQRGSPAVCSSRSRKRCLRASQGQGCLDGSSLRWSTASSGRGRSSALPLSGPVISVIFAIRAFAIGSEARSPPVWLLRCTLQ